MRDAENPLEPWDRQDGESPKAYAAFCYYRDMGPTRSLRKMMKADVPVKLGSWASLSGWSSKFSWVERAAAWEIDQRQRDVAEQVDKVRGMRKAHANIGTLMLSKAAQRLSKIQPEELTIRETVMLAELGAKLERQARGEPGETVNVQHTVGPARPSAEVITSDTLWRMLSENPHLADTMRQLEQAIEASTVPALVSGSEDSEIVDAEILDDDEADAG